MLRLLAVMLVAVGGCGEGSSSPFLLDHDGGSPPPAGSEAGPPLPIVMGDLGAPPDQMPLPTQPCTTGGTAAGDHVRTLSWKGVTRRFDLHVPPGHGSQPAPLVVDLHGYQYSPAKQKGLSGFLALSDKEGFLLVHPEGYGLSWNAGDACCGQAQQLKLDDVGLVRAIVDEVAALTCVDRARVYLTGFSNGGMLSNRIACQATDLVAAIAPVSSRLDLQPMSKCQPTRQVPVTLYHGRNDKVVVPADGEATFKFWSERNGCSGAPQVTEQGGLRCSRYVGCGAGPISYCTVEAEHIAYQNSDLAIAVHAWEFLRQHRLPAPPASSP